jgi:hypothetical protein
MPAKGSVPLVGRQPVQIEALEDPPHPRARDRDVVAAGQVHRDLRRTEVVVLAQVDDLADHVGVRCQWAAMRSAGSVTEPIDTVLVVAALPRVEALSADPVVAARTSDVAGDVLGVLEDRQASLGLAGELLLGQKVPLS